MQALARQRGRKGIKTDEGTAGRKDRGTGVRKIHVRKSGNGKRKDEKARKWEE